MKRILIALFLVLSLVICLPSCTDKVEENPEFAKFNEMFANDYDNYVINVVTTTPNGDMLNDKYVVSNVDGVVLVAYKLETLNEFVLDGDTITIPDGYKTVIEGVYKSDSLVEGQYVPDYKIPGFNFSSSCLNSEKITATSLSANITSISGFMGLNISGTDATVFVEYQDSTPNYIEIFYITEADNMVTITYTFN